MLAQDSANLLFLNLPDFGRAAWTPTCVRVPRISPILLEKQTMQLISQSNKMMGKRIAGPPLALLVLLLAVEALFSLFGLQVHYVEVWLVLAMVTLAF